MFESCRETLERANLRGSIFGLTRIGTTVEEAGAYGMALDSGDTPDTTDE